MNTADILRRARDHIADPAMWHKGDYWSDYETGGPTPAEDVPCCVLGAVMWVVQDPSLPYTAEPCPAFEALHRAAFELHQPLPAPRWKNAANTYNDDPRTTHADILAVFDKAIVLAEADGA